MSSLYGPVSNRGILLVSTQTGKISVTSSSRQRAVVGFSKPVLPSSPLAVRLSHNSTQSQSTLAEQVDKRKPGCVLMSKPVAEPVT